MTGNCLKKKKLNTFFISIDFHNTMNTIHSLKIGYFFAICGSMKNLGPLLWKIIK